MIKDYYNKNAQEFFNQTVKADMSELYDIFFKNLPYNQGKILDLGCGSGRDSKYFLESGFEVVALDISEELGKRASEYIGQKVIIQDMRELNYQDEFIGVWACASLLHLDEDEIVETLRKIFKSLKRDGIIYISFKYGDKNYEKDGRKFTCFTYEKFIKLGKEFENKILQWFTTEDVRADRKNEKWFNIVLKNFLN
jgi:SAM-dependent methyltransferase